MLAESYLMRAPTLHQWKHPSVRMFAAGDDPISLMLRIAADAALNAMQDGWHGPPFDPFALAELRRISVVPNDEVLDARTVSLSNDRLRIEYNPSRPRARVRYSVAHEIAHTFFPDCSAQVRNRAARANYQPNEWELEMLCNLGAAELLMPTGSLAEFKDKTLSIREILELRKKFEVSTESVLLRLVRVTHQPYTMFVASRLSSKHARYGINYWISSRASCDRPVQHLVPPKETVVSECTASGYTSVGDEEWPGLGAVHIECAGISPYPGHIYPRVIGLLRSAIGHSRATPETRFVIGDATNPHGSGIRILAHVVNDATPNWGAGFGRAVQQKWPQVQHSFRDFWCGLPSKRLGEVFFSNADDDLIACQMICQHGYGPSDRPRIRYAALRDCLLVLRDRALIEKASIHMPRIGSGEAGGAWPLVAALIDEVLCGAGVPVTIYDLPKNRKLHSAQGSLFDRAP